MSLLNLKKVFCSFFSLLLVFTMVPTVHAQTQEATDSEEITEYMIDEGNRTLFFQSEEDKNTYLVYKVDNEIMPYNDVVTKDYKLSATIYPIGAWIGPLSPHAFWTTATGYTIEYGKTLAATFSGIYENIGFSVTASKYFSYATHIYANPNYLSMLAIWQQYEVQNWRSDIYTGYGSVFQKSVYYNVVIKMGTPIVAACYQNEKPKCKSSYQAP